jgi:hypothetical protein
MFARRVAGAVLALLAAVPAGRAQTHSLAEAVKPGDCFRYGIEMKLSGTMRVPKEEKVVPIPLTAGASHSFTERVLAVGKGGLPEKSARVYESAKAVIGVGGDKSERSLRPERRLLVAARDKDQGLLYCPAGPLSRAELELTSEHFDTLALTGLLPGKGVKVGETWELSNAVAQAVCNLEVTTQKLTGKLEKAEGGVVVFSVSGAVSGVEHGALVKLKVEATGQFDVKAKRLVALEWKQKDERDQGPVNPATAVESTVTLKREAVAQPATLSDVALVSVPDGLTPPGRLLNLEYRDAKDRFVLLHAREWQLVGDTGDHVVLRLLDRGDFVAQVTVTPWTKAKKGEHLSAEDFKTAMHNTSGWRPEKLLQEGEVPSGDKRWIYRLSVLGVLDGVNVLQNFYLVASPEGDQVVLAFTLTPKQADKLGSRDLSLAASVEVPAKKSVTTGGRP